MPPLVRFSEKKDKKKGDAKTSGSSFDDETVVQRIANEHHRESPKRLPARASGRKDRRPAF